MTDKTSTLTEAEEAAAKAAGERVAKTGLNFLVTLAFYALFAWIGGVALNVGFGVHAPFVASWLLLAVGVSVVKAAASEVSDVWHRARVKADIGLIAASMAVQDMIQQQASPPGPTLASFLKTLDPENTDNGSSPYL